MKADLTGAPAFVPKLRLQGLRFLGRVRNRVVCCSRRFIRNSVLFIEPCAQIDEPAALAAEGPVWRMRRPFHRPPAGGAFSRRYHFSLRPESSAASQEKGHIHFHVGGAAGGIEPIQKPNGATMLAAADLGEQISVGRQGYTDQLAGVLAIELQLEYAPGGDFTLALRILPREPQQLRDAVA